MPTACPLCLAPAVPFRRVGDLDYWRCQACGLTFLDARHHLNASAERGVYDQHDNRVDDPHYRGFLNRLVEPILERLAPASLGLDYGCGPGPALAAMMRDAGHDMRTYDPYYDVDTGALGGRYDVITCTEAAEHFYDPRREFDRIDGLLRPGAWFGVMTCFMVDDDAFANWHYRRDPTHVCFYGRATLAWLARHYGWTLTIVRKDVALFHKEAG